MATDHPTEPLSVEDRLRRVETKIDEITSSNVVLPDLATDVRQVRETLPALTRALEKLDKVESRVEGVDHDSRRARKRFLAYCIALALVGSLVYLSLAAQRSASCNVRNQTAVAQAELLESLPLPPGLDAEYRAAFDRYLDKADVVDCSILRNPLG